MYWFLHCVTDVFTCHVFFFFKQKTAYEMRISDWSSDVCSSDLAFGIQAEQRIFVVAERGIDLLPVFRQQPAHGQRKDLFFHDPHVTPVEFGILPDQGLNSRQPRRVAGRFLEVLQRATQIAHQVDILPVRSEEHTSELQSLMRISYAVFCL